MQIKPQDTHANLDAKVAATELRLKLAEAEANSSSNLSNAENLYYEFCDTFGNEDSNLQRAWDNYQLTKGEIEINSLTEKLVIAAMQYALDNH